MIVSYFVFVKCPKDEKCIGMSNYNHSNEGSRLHEIRRQFLHSARRFLQVEGSECFYLYYVSNLE